MGLDMFFYASKYFSKSYVQKESDYAKLEKICQALELPIFLEIPHPRIETEIEIGYMRKANHIHGWIVENLANGEDECQRIYLDADNLKPLKEACEKVINIYETRGEVELQKLAPNILPTTQGFFFGGYAYDECYIEDCKDFLKIYKIIDNDFFEQEEYNFYYQASW